MSKIPVFVLLGPPGAGKSNIAKKIPQSQTIMMGNLIRKRNMDCSNALLPLAVVNKILNNELKNKENLSFLILDGYPRTQQQVAYLQSLAQIEIVKVLRLQCSDTECMDRVLNRESCSCGCSYHYRVKPAKISGKCDVCGSELFKRTNDTAEILQKRLKQYHQEEFEILSALGDKSVTIDMETDFKAGVKQALDIIYKTSRSCVLTRDCPKKPAQLAGNRYDNLERA